MIVTSSDISNAATDLGLENRPLAVHSSLSSFGHVDGGAQAVVDGLLAIGCSIAVPTFSSDYQVAAPKNMQPPRNGWDYDELYGDDNLLVDIFRPDSMEINRTMGAIPSAVLSMEGRVRGNHPLCSFAAVGPLAHGLIDSQSPTDVFAPLRAVAEMGGHYLLMGVNLTSMTAIHLAENMAGRNSFIRWARDNEGQPMMVFKGGCSEGFDRFDAVGDPIETRLTVGNSLWRVFPAQEFLDRCAKAIQEDPKITRCHEVECRCDDAILGGPILDQISLEKT
jgi:aminoglycoside 3-N-acetyltransferase